MQCFFPSVQESIKQGAERNLPAAYQGKSCHIGRHWDGIRVSNLTLGGLKR